MSQNPPIGDDRGSSPCPPAVNSQDNVHFLLTPLPPDYGAHLSESAPPSRRAPANTFRLPSDFGGVSPRRWASQGYKLTFSNGATVLPATISGPAAKKLAFICGSFWGSKPCMPGIGGWSGLPAGGLWARMA